ncbi:dephospho-CoA kinase, partial [Ameyamaea chiangmaiensis]
FLRHWRRRGARWVVLDIPLLLETDGARQCDLVAVVSASRGVQRARVAQRRGMSAAQADALIARQMPDALKRARADIVVHTGASLGRTRREVRALLRRLTRETS